MRKETIKEVVKKLNQSIQFYQRKLTYQLELKAERELVNGNLEFADLMYDYNPEDIEKYLIVIADLATIKRAIKKGNNYVKIIGTANRDNCDMMDMLYRETSDSLARAQLEYIDGYIYSIKEIQYEYPCNEYGNDCATCDFADYCTHL